MAIPISTWDELYRATDQPKTMTLTFSDGTVLHNADIILEQMSLEESLCSEENLRYGCCESSCFQVRIANTEKSFEGLYLNVVQAFPMQLSRLIDDQGNYIVDNQGNYINGGEMYFSQYGNFLVVSDTPTGDRQYRDLTCYDKMYEIIHANVYEWYDGLTFPISVKDFRDSFFEYLNVAQVETDLINDDFMIQGEFYVSEELSGRMVIESICELNGAFGHINRDGLFEYITLPTSDSLTYPHYINGSCAYEDYETEAITGVRVINVDGDSGTIVGTEDNMYIMQSNILTFGSEGTQNLEDALDNLLDLISEFTYTPFKVTTYGNPMLPLGTNVTFETKHKTINSFVMTRFLTGIQALRDTFTTLGDKLYPSDVNRIKNGIQRSAGVTHKLVNDVNTLDSEIFDEHGNSRIQQTLDEIVLKVDSAGNIGTIALGTDPIPYDPEDPDPTTQVTKVDINADFLKFVANKKLDLKTAKLNIESDGFSVTEDGEITATSGTIASFEIVPGSLKSGEITGLNDSSHEGVYLGTDGIRVNNAWGLPGSITMHYTKIERADISSEYMKTNYIQVGFNMGTATADVITANYTGCVASFYSVDVWSSLYCRGSKNRLIETKDYGERLLYSYETPTPMFGDIGEGTIADDGKCYVWLDPVFMQTIDNSSYQVFLQKYGQGDCWVSERKSNYFVVEGDVGLTFGWELKARQIDYSQRRLDTRIKVETDNPIQDYGKSALEHIQNIQSEREVV